MQQALLLFVIVAVFLVLKTYFAHARERKARANPPERRTIEVSLPRGIKDSNKRMQKLIRKINAATISDGKERREGKGQVDIVYLFTREPGEHMPLMRFLISSDPDKMDMIKRALKQAYDGNASVTELKDTPLDEVIEELKPKEVTG